MNTDDYYIVDFGSVCTLARGDFTVHVWRWTPTRPIPYKRNKHRYGR